MPQWNCSCPNCQAARQGLIPSRTQSCVAVADHTDAWFLVNASPDLSIQLQRFSDLQPRAHPARNTPLAGVLLTNADLDHLLGLFSLREGGCLNIYAAPAVRRAATTALGLETVLGSFCGSRWLEPPAANFERISSGAEPSSSLLYRAIELPGNPPPFARNSPAAPSRGHSVAYQFLDPRSKRRLLVAPDVAAVTQPLRDALATSDAVLFDGTFWSGDELKRVRPDAPGAADMGHVTIQDGSLDLLAKLPASKKVYIHINNTNPILAVDSTERAAVEAAGIIVGFDGLEFEL